MFSILKYPCIRLTSRSPLQNEETFLERFRISRCEGETPRWYLSRGAVPPVWTMKTLCSRRPLIHDSLLIPAIARKERKILDHFRSHLRPGEFFPRRARKERTALLAQTKQEGGRARICPEAPVEKVHWFSACLYLFFLTFSLALSWSNISWISCFQSSCRQWKESLGISKKPDSSMVVSWSRILVKDGREWGSGFQQSSWSTWADKKHTWTEANLRLGYCVKSFPRKLPLLLFFRRQRLGFRSTNRTWEVKQGAQHHDRHEWIWKENAALLHPSDSSCGFGTRRASPKFPCVQFPPTIYQVSYSWFQSSQSVTPWASVSPSTGVGVGKSELFLLSAQP